MREGLMGGHCLLVAEVLPLRRLSRGDGDLQEGGDSLVSSGERRLLSLVTN